MKYALFDIFEKKNGKIFNCLLLQIIGVALRVKFLICFRMTFPEVLNLNHLIDEYSASPDTGQTEETTEINGPSKDDDG